VRLKVRVGILIDGVAGPRWVASVLQAIRRSGDAQVAAVRVDVAPRPRTNPAPLLYRVYEDWDHRIFASDDDPSAIEDMGSLLAAETVGEAGEDRRLDVVFDLRGVPRGAVPELTAAHGVWRFHFGDHTRHGTEVPLFRELMEGNVTCTLSLAREPGTGMNGSVAYRHYAAIDPTSLTQTAAELRWKASTLATRLLADLALHGRPAGASAVSPHAPQPNGYPGSTEMIRYLGRLAAVLAASKLEYHLSREHWTVGIRKSPGGLEDPMNFRLPEFVPLPAPTGHYFADPFPIRVDGNDYVFFEDYSYRDERGRIGYVELDAEGRPGAPRTALQRDYHLSYPFVFHLDGSVFMVPETLEARRVELYRAVRFPEEWCLERVLIEDVAAVDATLLWHAGKVWLFASVEAERGAGYDQLHVFHADTLASAWTPHRANPVKTDVRSSRPAGSFFRRNDRLIRPSQDGSGGYGGAIRFCEVLQLSETEFEEKEVGCLRAAPRSGLRGVHTINASEGVAVVDWKRIRPAFRSGRT
jgi:hypothetical protein